MHVYLMELHILSGESTVTVVAFNYLLLKIEICYRQLFSREVIYIIINLILYISLPRIEVLFTVTVQIYYFDYL